MDKGKFSKIFPDPPSGIGLSKQFFWTLVGGLVILMVLFLYFLHHYQPKAMTIGQEQVMINHTEAVSLIEDIKSHHSKQKPVIQFSRMTSVDNNQTNHVDKPFLKAAASSSISVYTGFNKSTGTHESQFDRQSSNKLPNSDNGLRLPQSIRVNAYQQQNQQSEKSNFLKDAARDKGSMIGSRAQLARSPYTLHAGTILPATLQTGINSDLPGTIIAKVRRDVFDSVTGNYLLVPQGSTLIGTYDSEVAYGQKRVLIAWSRLILPNGVSQNLEGQKGVDLMGLAGLHDKTNNHYLRLFGSALMFSVFGAAAQLSQPQATGSTLSPQQIIAGAIGQQLSQTGAQVVAKNMNIQPTLNIRPGANFNVLLARDLILPGPYGVAK